MPRHRRRPGQRRYLLLAALGAILLSGIGSIVAGTILAPPPEGGAPQTFTVDRVESLADLLQAVVT